MTTTSFATVDDLEVRWRPLSDAERPRAAVLLDDASGLVRRRFPTLDARVADGALAYMDVVRVVAGMVKRVLIGGDVEGVMQRSQTMGPFGVASTFSNPMGNLYLTAEDVATLRDPALSRARSVRLSAYGE